MDLNQCKEENKEDYRICRLCLSKNANTPIFPIEKIDAKNAKGPPLVCKIMSCVNIQVRKDDGLPTHICTNCASKVESTYDFLRLCEMSDSFLRQYVDFGRHIWILHSYSELLRMLDTAEEEPQSD